MIKVSGSILWRLRRVFVHKFVLLIVPGFVGNWRSLGGTYRVKWVMNKQLRDSKMGEICPNFAAAS